MPGAHRKQQKSQERLSPNPLFFDILFLAGYAWTIEHYHRGIKQYCGVERAQVRAARAQRNHIGLALRAFLRLEWHCYRTGISGFEAKTVII